MHRLVRRVHLQREIVPPGDILQVEVEVAIGTSVSKTLSNMVEVAGGGAGSKSIVVQNAAGLTLAPFAINDFLVEGTGVDGATDSQAGGHPYAVTTALDFTTQEIPSHPNIYTGSENAKDTVVDLPPGFIGNPQTVPQCPVYQFEQGGDPSLSIRITVRPTRRSARSPCAAR